MVSSYRQWDELAARAAYNSRYASVASNVNRGILLERLITRLSRRLAACQSPRETVASATAPAR
jgi:hypothetical protein